MRTPSDEFLRDVAITAVEGWISYWATVEEYKWQDPVTGFELPWPIVRLSENDTSGVPVKNFILTARDLRGAVRRLCEGVTPINGFLRETLASAVDEDDAGMVDAELADCIVQVALFNEIVYS